MSKFKVGDRIIANEKSNSLYEITNLENNWIGIVKLVNNHHLEVETISCNSLNGMNENFYVMDEYFDLIQEISTKEIELKIDKNKIDILEKKEGNNMVESLNLLDLYERKQTEKLEKTFDKVMQELRENCDAINKYKDLVEQFKKACDELYLSQFTEEEKGTVLSEHTEIDDSDKQLRKNLGGFERYRINNSYETGEMKEVIREYDELLKEKRELIKTVKAHIGIAKSKEEVEEILKRYEILDKKGRIVVD